jgi:hypothetical protein
MKITTTSALLLSLGAVLAVACSADNDPDRSLPAPVERAAVQATVAQAPKSANPERSDLDPQLAGQSEAFAQEVPPELTRQLEADYQAKLKQMGAEKAQLLQTRGQMPVNFEAVLEQIRKATPPLRAMLSAEYVRAAKEVTDPAEQKALLDRLGSSGPNDIQ